MRTGTANILVKLYAGVYSRVYTFKQTARTLAPKRGLALLEYVMLVLVAAGGFILLDKFLLGDAGFITKLTKRVTCQFDSRSSTGC